MVREKTGEHTGPCDLESLRLSSIITQLPIGHLQMSFYGVSLNPPAGVDKGPLAIGSTPDCLAQRLASGAGHSITVPAVHISARCKQLEDRPDGLRVNSRKQL